MILTGQPGDPSIKRAAVDVRKTKSLGELARDRALSGSGRPINSNHGKFGDVGRIQFFSKASAGLMTSVGGFSSGAKNLCSCSGKPGYDVAMQSVSWITV